MSPKIGIHLPCSIALTAGLGVWAETWQSTNQVRCPFNDLIKSVQATCLKRTVVDGCNCRTIVAWRLAYLCFTIRDRGHNISLGLQKARGKQMCMGQHFSANPHHHWPHLPVHKPLKHKHTSRRSSRYFALSRYTLFSHSNGERSVHQPGSHASLSTTLLVFPLLWRYHCQSWGNKNEFSFGMLLRFGLVFPSFLEK